MKALELLREFEAIHATGASASLMAELQRWEAVDLAGDYTAQAALRNAQYVVEDALGELRTAAEVRTRAGMGVAAFLWSSSFSTLTFMLGLIRENRDALAAPDYVTQRRAECAAGQ